MNIDMKDVLAQLADEGIEDVKASGVTLGMRKAATFMCKYPCKHCGERERYVSSRGCIQCQYEKHYSHEYHKAKLAREAAVEAGSKTYEGRACKVCGSTTKYTANAGCIACAASKRDKFRANAAKRYHSADSLLMWVHQKPAKGYEKYYQLIPALAARPDAGEWSVRYTDAKHLMPGGDHLYTGWDVMERPDFARWLITESHMGIKREGGHHDILPHIKDALHQAYLDYCRNKHLTRNSK